MSPKLKPLLLPQLVEERKKMEVQSHDAETDRHFAYYTHNSSSSDVTSPLTPTFSARGHMRYSSSTSSLELPPMLCADSPVSPTLSSAASTSGPPSHKAAKRQLPDVQEEPMEREDEDTIVSDQFDLYNCLCDEPCVHNDSTDMIMSAYPSEYDELDYDYAFMSDSDYQRVPGKQQRGDLSGLASRFGTRFPSLSRWASTKRSQPATATASPTPETGFENLFSTLSRRDSSRSSSLSTPSRHMSNGANDPTFPPTPARSFWDSSESVALSAIDVEKANNRRPSIERERALATTPLLPPLLTAFPIEHPQQSPLQSPSVAPSRATSRAPSRAPSVVGTDMPSPLPYSHAPTPSLSAKPSYSSFRPSQDQPTQSHPSAIPGFVQDHDDWSDRLGHANFTITPQPYRPEDASQETLHRLRADWDAARVNYTKHIVRTGENYGQTSKIYALTEAKWAEIDREWRDAHERTLRQVPSKTEDPLPNFVSVRSATQSSSRSRSRGRGRGRAGSAHAAPAPMAMIPRLADAEGKFPSRGDEDIVGPMVRDAYMVRAVSEDRKGRFWRQLADRVGLRR
ncbi:hypothetical protein HYQ45_000591 [Verticillium longisporum]|uniref:Only prolin and serin are matching in the corresponding protein n=1 Tax=Verticillium longisporum TaxID=100787 RepID=A0A8I3A0T7_VERLO|nr:hypothetical protein VdG1_08976 [Verticillium dahliae VDG1]KAG7143124.1 hypothetical protein HYQ45_000591 [Verticillium longisporum]PNH41535.1 hypothetical protein VD0004_g5589 [Verticillium dahliae]PNH72119.1 hypothetical protein VD0001_g5407 [Verticillium dahliae]RBQ88430.1 hypothetical protein VDGD_20636 [Verticillium dahliae]